MALGFRLNRVVRGQIFRRLQALLAITHGLIVGKPVIGSHAFGHALAELLFSEDGRTLGLALQGLSAQYQTTASDRL